MKKLLAALDLQDVQLVAGTSSLGYGLYLVYPPAMFIALGLFLIIPVLMPVFKAAE